MVNVLQDQLRQYDIRTVAPFKKTNEKWGALSNMASGFPIVVNGVSIKSIEALYQSCRYPHNPEIQHHIISQSSPMTAKMVSKPHLEKTRKSWESDRVMFMRWCLRVKLAQNWEKFSKILLDTGDMPIVELSNKDNFWGAIREDDNIYIGVNTLGRLLMELREKIKVYEKEVFLSVNPIPVKDFFLHGQQIKIVYSKDNLEHKPPQMGLLD